MSSNAIRIGLMADIHLEFEAMPRQAANKHQTQYGPEIEQLRSADLVLIAGDTASHPNNVARYVENLASELGSVPIAFIIGNHEAYGGVDLLRIFAFLRDRFANHPSVHFLEAADPACSASVKLTIKGRQLLVLGSCLWTDFNLFGKSSATLAKEYCRALINDFRGYCKISEGQHLQTSDTANLHSAALGRMTKIAASNLARKRRSQVKAELLILSHMAPSMRSISENFKNDLTSAYFASDLEAWIAKYQPSLWVHGHTHIPCNYTIGNTRIFCHPRGYFGREPGANVYKPRLIDLHFDGHKVQP